MTAENLVQLLPLARELSDSNKILQDRESIIRQLTLLKNVNSIQKSSGGLKSMLRVESSVSPGVQCENIAVTIRHVLKGHDFDPRFWSFHLSISGEKKACSWNLSKMFIEGDCEKFSVQILPRFINFAATKCQTMTISLAFCMQWAEVYYSTVFPLHHFDMDLLDLLSPGARAGFLIGSLAPNTLRQYPPVTKFSLRTTERVFEMFIVDILLKDVNESRGFGLKGTTSEIMKAGGDFVAYVGQDRITLSSRKDGGRTYVLTFMSSNSQVLRLFKAGVYLRMLRLCESDVLRLKSSSGKEFETLDGLRLRLEVLGKGESSKTGIKNQKGQSLEDWSDFVQFYHELREGSDSLVEFRHVNDTKVVSR